MDWIPEFYDPEILKDIEAIEDSVATKPGFDLYRRKLKQGLIADSDRLAGFTAEQLIKQTDTFEELIVMKEYLQARFAGDHVWWEEYHKRRIELAMLPSNYGSIGGQERFALPVSPERIKRSNVAGLRGVGVRRNLAGQLFTRRELQGLDPIQLSTKGVRFEDFIHAQRRPAKNYFAFDLETTGLTKQLAYKETGRQRGVISLGFSFRNAEGVGEGMSLADLPSNRPYFGEYIEDSIIPKHLTTQKSVRADLGLQQSSILKRHTNEQKIVRQFIDSINKDKKAALLGYNIEQFDIPYLKVVSKRYGMYGELEKALKGRDVVDVGHYAKAFLSEQLGAEKVGWQEGMFKELKLNPAGWKQQALAHAFDFNHAGKDALSSAAHTPFFDVKMTEHVYKTLSEDGGKEAFRLWNEQKVLADGTKGLTGRQRYDQALKSLDQRLIGISELEKMTVRKGNKTFLNLPEWMIPEAPRSTSFAERLKGAVRLGAAKPAPEISEIMGAGREIFENAPDRKLGQFLKGSKTAGKIGKVARFAAVGGAIGVVAPGEGMSNLVGGYAGLASYNLTRNKTGKASLGFAAGVAAYGFVKGINSLAFSGRDDNYNVISGLRHGGAAQATRKALTEFGSGYQGQKLMIYNQEIDPEIQEFRHRWLSTPTQEKLLKEEMKAAGESVEQVRDLEASEMTAAGKFQKVNLDDYKWEFEDPDTLLLRRKGLWNFFDDPVAVRMTGIDAPEIKHKNDALDWSRYEQDQPYGQEATERAKDLWEGKEGMSILIDPERQTYGRYLGILKEEGNKKSVNVQMVEQGIAAALPWGDSGSDMISRKTLIEAEKGAIAEEKGMWGEDYFKRYLDIAGATGRRITFTSFSDKSRLAKNYSLAAAQELMSRDDVDYEPWMGKFIGSKLRKSYGPRDNKNKFTAKDNAYNTIEGIHPGSQGMGAESVRQHSMFGSGWQGGLRAGGMIAGIGAAVVAGVAGAFAASKTLFKKTHGDILEGSVESDGQRKRRRKKEKAEVDSFVWAQKYAENRYSRFSMFSSEDQNYISKGGWKRGKNSGKFAGMGNESEGAWAGAVRAGITEFKGDHASRWDPTVQLAKKLFGNNNNAMGLLRELPEFQQAIKTAMNAEGKLLGVGKTGRSYARTGSFEYKGATHSFDFVSKELRTIDDMITGVPGYQDPMPRSLADIFHNLAKNDSIKRETSALKKLEWMGEKNRAPSFYGATDDVIMMEKFNVVDEFDKVAMTAQEGEQLTGFMKEAHKLKLSHTDLHGENMVRVMVKEGDQMVEEAAVLDWGMAGRLGDTNPQISYQNQIAVNKLSKESLGRSLSLEEYSNMADLKRIDSFVKGQQKIEAHFMGINTLMSTPSSAKGIAAQREAIGEVLAFGGGKRISAQPLDLSGPGKVVPDSQAWKLEDFLGGSSAPTGSATNAMPVAAAQSATVAAGPAAQQAQRVEAVKAQVVSAINHMNSAPAMSLSKTVAPGKQGKGAGLGFHKTMLQENEKTIPQMMSQSQASLTLRRISDKNVRIPHEAYDRAIRHGSQANKMK